MPGHAGENEIEFRLLTVKGNGCIKKSSSLGSWGFSGSSRMLY
jgi:hypothetical protein